MNTVNDISKRHGNIQNDITVKSINSIDVFKNPQDRALFAIAKKVEKIVAAIYLVTDVMEMNLPLTTSLREESLVLSSVCYQLLTQPEGIKLVHMTRVVARMEQVISLVKIGRIAHHISDMNADVITKELERVLDTMIGETKIVSDQQSVHPDHAKFQPVVAETMFRDRMFDAVARDRKIVQIATEMPKIQNDISKRHQNDIKTTNEIKTTIVSQNDIVKTTSINQNDSERKAEILNVIKTRKNATIQDIKTFVKNCSEKTLQREIAGLIAVGAITKEGNKRWTTYHVA